MLLGIGTVVATDLMGEPASADSDLLVSSSASASTDANGEAFVLAGATFDLTMGLENVTAPGADLYNAAFTLLVPAGLELVESDALLGSPRVLTGPLFGVADDFELWVWEDVADLPAGAALSATITVRPPQPPVGTGETDDPTVFPVGSVVDTTTVGYASTEPRYLPVFLGSTGKFTETTFTASGSEAAHIPVQAIDVTKSEPSDESELVRGVHAEHTTYTLTVRNTSQGETDNVVLVDYLPAGLEYLGDGTDHSAADYVEYTGSDRISGDAPAEYVAANRVETIVAGDDDPRYLSAGEVYTKVTWNLGTLDEDELVTIRYRAAIPLHENVMWPVGEEPDPGSGAQAANLDNNTGDPTREGSTDPASHEDGMSLENFAAASGQYAGVVRAGADRTTQDSAAFTVTAEDLAISKRASADALFRVGEDVVYTLTLRTGEYASASDLLVVDTLPDGLYPRLPLALKDTVGTLMPPEWFVPDGEVHGAEVVGLEHDPAAGIIRMTFAPTSAETPFVLAPSDEHEISYSIGMREDYQWNSNAQGFTTSGDSFTNNVEVTGTTTPLAALGTEPRYVSDVSSATIGSAPSHIVKEVLARDGLLGFDGEGTPLVNPAKWVDGTTVVPDGFTVGDTVVYRLTVEFPDGVDTRNPMVGDMVPAGVTPGGWVYSPTANSLRLQEQDNAPQISPDGQRIRWALGAVDTDSGSDDRFVSRGTDLEILVWGTVSTLSVGTAAATPELLDKPENLAKYRYENVEGTVFFNRDQASILVEPGISLLKGVRDVQGVDDVDPDPARDAASSAADDGTLFDSDRDGITVRQREDVTYRIDLSAPKFATTDIVVWDALPEGIDESMVDGFRLLDRDGTELTTGFSAEAIDPGGPGTYPADVHEDFDERSIVVWTIDEMAGSTADVAAGLTLLYTVTMPDDALVDQRFDNLASIVRYDTVANSGGTGATLVPMSPISTTAADEDAGELAIDGEFTTDGSWVQLPPASIAKVRHETEIVATQNTAAQAVEGELITYRYTLTVPAHTTIPEGSTLADGRVLSANANMTSARPYVQLGSATLVAPGTMPAEVELDPNGTLRFVADFDNATNDAIAFTVQIVVHTSDFSHDNTLRNRATFTNSANPTAPQHAIATVQYRTIAPTLTKQVRPAGTTPYADAVDVTAGAKVEFVLTASNPNNRPTSYDTVVVDCVPAALILEPIADADAVVDDPSCVGGTLITWNAGEIAPGASKTLTYTATVSPASAGSAAYVNEAALTGYTLPDTLPDDPEGRRGSAPATADATVNIVPAEITKSVSQETGTIGDVFDYTVTVTLPADVNFYNAVFNDVLPDGLEVVGTPDISSDDGDLVFTPHPSDELTWSVHDAGTPDTIEAVPAPERVITLTYQARMVDVGTAADPEPDRGDVLTNTAAFTWTTTEAGGTGTERSVTTTEDVTVTEPRLAISKKVDGLDEKSVALDGTFTYTVTVTNTGNADAHHIEVTDVVPAGVIVTGSIPENGELTGADSTTGGGTITWEGADLPGPLAPSGTIVLSYMAKLAVPAELDPSAQTPAGWWVNTATVTHYESHPTHGREYDPTTVTDTARVMPLFPHVELAKSVGTQGAVAYIGTPFEWQLTLTNTGAGAVQTVTAVDTLPENWFYVDGSAMVSIAGGPQVPLADPDENGRELTWIFGSSTDAPILAGAVGTTTPAIVITFTAIPGPGVVTAPTIGSGINHTNTLTATVTDVTDAPTNGEGPREYVGPDDDAAAQIHVADLAIVKTGATAPLVAGSSASTGWTLVVTNEGDDPAVGPFRIVDLTDALPAGVTITGLTGSGWSLASQTTNAGAVTSVYEYGTASTTLAPGASLQEFGITVRVAADYDPADLPLGLIDNAAAVSSPTYDEDDTNNESSDDIEITTSADLEIEKSVTTASPNAGSAITWALEVTNHGPSVSRASVANPITVTDLIPAGVTNVTMPSLPAGWTSNIPVDGSLTAGDTLTLTYTGAPLAVNAVVSFTLNGTVLASHLTGTLSNTAEVTPRETPDPDEENNDDTETTPIGTATELGVTKIRVVFDDDLDEWVPAVDDIVAGETVTYRVVVANSGPADAMGVTILDTLTAGLEAPVTYQSLVGTWTAGTATAPDYRFNLDGNLAVGASASLLVTATAASDLAPDDDVVNSVLATATNDPDGDDDEDTGGPVRVADLEIAKSHDLTVTPVAGGTLDYTIEVTNLGPSSATGPFTITDLLPADFGYVEDSALVDGSAVEPDVAGQLLTWTIGDATTSLAVGDTITIDLTTAIGAAVTAGAYENTATVDSPDDDNPLNDLTTDEVTTVTEADVTILKEAGAAPHVAGDSVTYTLTVENEGPSVARNVTVTDVPDAGLTITGMSGDTGWDCTVATATCTFTGVLPVGISTITVTVDIASWVLDDTELDNEATVRWTDSDGPREDDDPETITVTAIADLSVIKSLASPTLDAGTTGRYRVEVSNHEDASDAVTVTVTDELPTGLAYAGGLTSAGAAWSYSGTDTNGDPVFALTGSLAAGASTWLEFDVTVDDDLTGDVTNVAIARSPVDPEEPDDDEITTVGTTTNLVIVKERSGTPGDARIGDTTEFLITVTNEGPAVATGVEVTDTLPTGLTFTGVTVPATGAGWTFDPPVGDVLTATLDDPLAVGGTVSLTVTALVEVEAYTSATNIAVVAADNPETDYDDNTSDATVPVAPQVDLGIVKELVTAQLQVGQAATYRLTVTNHGVTEDPGPITVRDALPVGLAYASSDSAECDAVDDEFECVYTDALAVGDTIVIQLTVDVLATAYPSVTNTATVSTASEDTDPDNNTSTVTDPVTPDVRFALEKSVASSTDDTVTWEITVTSVGLNDAFDGVEVTDTLPAELTFVSAHSDDGIVCEADIDRGIVCLHADPLPSGESATFQLVTTTTQKYGSTVINTAEVTDGFVVEPLEPVEASANHMRNLPATGWSPWALALLALLALSGGIALTTSVRNRAMR